MLKVTSLKKNYGDNEVLKGIDIEIEKGEVVAIIGLGIWKVNIFTLYELNGNTDRW